MKFGSSIFIGLGIVLTAILVVGSELVETAGAIPAQTYPLYQVDIAPIPIFVGATTDQITEPKTSADSILVLDVPSASILYQKNSHAVHAPASTTKLMTALLIRESYDLSQTIVAPFVPSIGGARVNLVSGKVYSVYDILQAMLIPSANDAAYILAAQYPGGVSAFVDRMNEKAKEIGMNQTQFENPAGFDDIVHRTTAYDLALLSLEIMKDPVLAHIVGTQTALITDQDKTVKHSLQTTNQLLGVVPGIVGIKTGTTSQAGEVLISEYVSDSREILMVVLGSENRYADTTEVLDWVLTSYEWRSDMVE